MPEFIRVSWKAHGHESTIPAHRFDEDRHKRLDKVAVDSDGDPLPPKYKTSVAKQAAAKKATPSGQQAASDKETS